MKSRKLLFLQVFVLAGCFCKITDAYPDNSSTLPRFLNASDILNNLPASTEIWTGLNPADYSDMRFYKNGSVHIKGRINDYSAESGFSTLTISTSNMLTDRSHPIAPSINPDGTFAFDVTVDYPQFSRININNSLNDIFLSPGDTLDIITTAKTLYDQKRRSRRSEYFGFTGEPNDAVAISLLADSLKSHFDLFNIVDRYSLYKGFSDIPENLMEQTAYDKNSQVAAELGKIVSEMPRVIGKWPVNKWVKDVIAAKTFSVPAMLMEDIESLYREANPSSLSYDAEEKMLKFTEGKSLDMPKLYAPRLPYLDILYRNPLLITCDHLFNNRWSFNKFFKTGRCLAGNNLDPEDERTWREEGETVFSKISKVDEENLKNVGIGDCFAAQAARTYGFISSLKTSSDPEKIPIFSQIMTDVIRQTDYEPLIKEMTAAYTDYVISSQPALPEGKQTSILLDIDSENDVLKEIISPYLGNVIYLDFWGINCGPCRSGMVNMKPLIDYYAASPFKVIYIANADENRTACEKWLREEEIKGEHLFVSSDNWNRLRELFGFSSIPHEVLIDKNGQVIANDYRIMSLNDPLLKKALSQQ